MIVVKYAEELLHFFPRFDGGVSLGEARPSVKQVNSHSTILIALTASPAIRKRAFGPVHHGLFKSVEGRQDALPNLQKRTTIRSIVQGSARAAFASERCPVRCSVLVLRAAHHLA